MPAGRVGCPGAASGPTIRLRLLRSINPGTRSTYTLSPAPHISPTIGAAARYVSPNGTYRVCCRPGARINMMTSLPLLLASASPRRSQILSLLALPYQVCVSPVDEEATQKRYSGPIEDLAAWLAEQKALGALTLPEAAGYIVVTADTTVLLNGELLGKPRDTAHAREMLLSLRDRWHHVITGLAVSKITKCQIQVRNASCITPVLIPPYSAQDG